ncbi:MAG: hypothetical protein ACTSUE_14670, partial [Promethearchaeota archaeon]
MKLKNESKNNREDKGMQILVVSYVILFSILIGGNLILKEESNPDDLNLNQPSPLESIGTNPVAADSFDYLGHNFSLSLPDFWEEEYNASKIFPLNLTVLENYSIVQQPDQDYRITNNVTLNVTHVTFTPCNYSSSPMIIDADIYEPAAPQPAGTLPGVLLLHGLGGSKGNNNTLAMKIAARGAVCIAISLPGHGNSGGPPPLPDHIFNYSRESDESRKSP